MLKSKGPKTDPCGIPVVISYQELKEQPILVLCLRLFRWSKILFKLILSRPDASKR